MAASASPLGRDESSQLYLPAAAPSYSMGFFFFACLNLFHNWFLLFGHGFQCKQTRQLRSL